MNTRRARVWLSLCGIGLLAALAQVYATTGGLAASPDSRYYIEAARRLAATGSLTTTAGGFAAPLVRFPPLLSIVLAVAGALLVDPLAAAHWLNGGLLFANVVLSGVLIHNLSSGSRLLALAGALLVAGLNALFYVYVWAWSEPLFIFLLLLAFVVLAAYPRRLRPWLLALAGLLVGLAWLTRYVGGAFAVGIALWLALPPGPLRARAGRLVPFLAASALPIGLWLLRNVLLIGRPTEHVIGLHGLTAAKFSELPGTGFVSFSVCLGLAALAARLLRLDFRLAWQRIWPRSVIACLWLCVLIYLPVLLLSITFLDPGIPLEDRILSPALMLLIISSFSALAYISIPEKRAQPVRLVAAALYGAYLLAGLAGLAGFAAHMHRDGDGFTSRAWKISPTIAAILALPPGALIYSNGEEAIYLLTGRITRSLPRQTDATYQRENDALRRDLVENEGVVVVFSGLAYRLFLSQDKITQLVPSLAAVQLGDGVVLSVKPVP
jgi:hypothetical protein